MSDSLRYRSSPNGDIGGETDLWDWDAWEVERYTDCREDAKRRSEADQRRDLAKLPVLLDEIERLEVRAYLFEQLAFAAVELVNDLRERWEFEARLLADVLRERREGGA